MEAPICLTAVDPADIKILSERPDGSGVIEMPILSEMATLDLGLTASGTKGTDSITRADMESAVANFPEWPGPVPVHVYPHRSFAETAGPGDGFIERLFMRGNQVWAQMDLTAPLFAEVKARRWRGFSIDGARRIRTATKAFSSFTIYGGVFTNRPASDVHAKVAAGTEIEADLRTFHTPIKGNGVSMADENQDPKVRLATVEAEVKIEKDNVVRLEGKLKESTDAIVEKEKERASSVRQLGEAQASVSHLKLSVERLTVQTNEDKERIEQLESDKKELKLKLSEREDDATRTKVVNLCNRAIKEGVPPAKIKQFGDYEKDPVKFASGFGSLETMELVLKSLPREAALAAVNSGRETGESDASAVTPASADSLRKLNLDPDFASVSTESEARALYEKKAARK